MYRLLAVFTIFFSIGAHAELLSNASSVVIQSPRVSFVNGAQYQSIAVRNVSESIMDFSISLRTEETDPSRPTVVGMIRLTKSFMTLAPDAQDQVGLVLEMPDMLPDGEYTGVLEIKGEESVQPVLHASHSATETMAALMTPSSRSIPVVIRKGNLKADVTLSDNGVVEDEQGAWLKVDLVRTGERSVFGDIKVSGKVAPYLREEVLMMKKSVSVEISEDRKTVALRVPKDLDLYDYPELKVAFKERRRHGGRQKATLVIPLR